MRGKLFVLLIVAGLIVISSIPALAATSEFTGTFTHDDPYLEGLVPDSVDCDPADAILFATHYHVINYNAPVSGQYEYLNPWDYGDVDASGAAGGGSKAGRTSGSPSRSAIPDGILIDVVIQLYPEGTFNPDDTLANCLGSYDDYGLFDLAAGNYDLVVMTYWTDEAGDYYFTITGPDAPAVRCPYPLPPGSAVYDIPAGAPAFYEASLDAPAGFNIPAGTWYISEFSGDFAKLWVACEGTPVWVPSNAVAH